MEDGLKAATSMSRPGPQPRPRKRIRLELRATTAGRDAPANIYFVVLIFAEQGLTSAATALAYKLGFNNGRPAVSISKNF